MRRATFLAAALLSVFAAMLHAQTTFATITGTVLDPSGLAIPGARVDAVQRESGYKYQTQTNEAGVYTLADLRAGAYDVSVIAGGFKDAVIKDVQLFAIESVLTMDNTFQNNLTDKSSQNVTPDCCSALPDRRHK